MGDRFSDEIEARHHVALLHALLRAIPKWEEVATTELLAAAAEDTSTLPEPHRQMRADEINDAFYMVHLTKNSLCAGLAVAITAAVENFLKTLGTNWERLFVPIQQRGKAQEGWTIIDVSGLSGYHSVNRSRLLNNCFKHGGGLASHILATTYMYKPNEEILFENEDWHTIVADVGTFLLEIVKAVHRPPEE